MDDGEHSGRCDLMISNALIIDGTGAPARSGGVAVESGRIAMVGDLSGWRADETIDAGGQVLSPGFIDCHTHDDRAVLTTPDMTAKVSQGVTSVVAGNCGISLAPFASGNGFPPPFPLLGGEVNFRYPSVADYRAEFERSPPAVNLALLAGHSSLRVSVMGDSLDRDANAEELAAMGDLLRSSLQQGCIGFSTGLGYPPARAAPPEEIVDLARQLRAFDGAIYATHMRDEGDHVLDAVRETVQTGRDADVPVVISHHKCAGPKNYGRSRDTLSEIAKARKHQRIGLDVYPYTASSTVLLPEYIRESEDVLVTYSEPHPEFGGMRLVDIVSAWKCTTAEAVARLYPAGAIYFQMNEEDLKRILSSPGAMVGSDGLPGQSRPHPRLWGTFPRVLSRYVRDQGLLSLEDAVHRMTGLTAKTFGLAGRGVIASGNAADLVLFDPETIEDAATFEDPEQPARGINLVMVSGRPVWHRGRSTGQRPGQFLHHQA
jgi:N-acyl-D-amino-acid deacylase